MIVCDTPGLLVSCDAKNTLVCFEFKGFVEGESYRRPLTEALKFLSTRKIERLLWDVRRMRVLTPEDQVWAERDWTPRLVKETHVRRSALLVPQSVIGQMSLKRVAEKAAPVMENEIEIKYFDSREAAEKWLRDGG
jgi:hypothetical protein